MNDVNVYLGRWPFRRLPCESAGALAARLRHGGVRRAWVGSLDGLFNRDVGEVNRRLVEECRQADRDLLMPFGTVNPSLPDWERDVAQCKSTLGCGGIRLHPAYHGYQLGDAVFKELLGLADRIGLIVQIVVAMEDERTQQAALRTPTVDCKPLVALAARHPQLPMILLNAFRKLPHEEAATLANAGNVHFDTANLEGVDRLAALADKVGVDRIVAGSFFPLFYLEAMQLKLRETKLPHAVLERISTSNAQRLLKASA